MSLNGQQLTIHARNLSKVYRNGHHALCGLSFDLYSGITGLLGPNGAGKTTLMKILVTLLRPTEGDVQIASYSVMDKRNHPSIRSLVGYLPQANGFMGELSVEENLIYFAMLKRIPRGKPQEAAIACVLERTSLTYVRRERADRLSGGMLRRLGIAITLLGNPHILVTDEPTANLDPAERMRFRNLLIEIAESRLVLMSTHLVEDVAQVGNQLLVLNHGHLIFTGSITDFVRRTEAMTWAVGYDDVNMLDASTTVLLGAQLLDGALVQRVISAQKPHINAVSLPPTVEDAYLYMLHTAR